MAHNLTLPAEPEPDGSVKQVLSQPEGRNRIFGQIFRSVKNHQLADELCQEVCKKLLLKQAQYDPSRGTVWAWISGFVRNQIASYFSRKTRQHEQLGTAKDELPSREGSEPIEHLQQAELLQQLNSNLNKLSERSRDVLWRHYIQGESDIVSAHRLGITPENLRQIRRRALRELRHYCGVSEGVTG